MTKAFAILAITGILLLSGCITEEQQTAADTKAKVTIKTQTPTETEK